MENSKKTTSEKDFHKEITRSILDAKIVNYEALGKTFSNLGPSLALRDDPWETFCGTMKFYIRIFRLPPIGPGAHALEGLEKLQNLKNQL